MTALTPCPIAAPEVVDLRTPARSIAMTIDSSIDAAYDLRW